jgi:DNA-binding NtrC family response regulator
MKNGKVSILIVDDEPLLLETMRIVLAMGGYEVQTAADGIAALEIFKNRRQPDPIDIIISDIAMPHLDGYALAKEIRKTDAEILIVLITGFGLGATIGEAADLQIEEYIGKPFNVEQIALCASRCAEKVRRRNGQNVI